MNAGVKIRKLVIHTIAGVISGALFLGIGGRLIMRLIAVLGDINPGFSPGGTLEVIALGAIIGGITGFVLAITGNFLPKHGLYGVLYGLISFLVVLLLPIEAKKAAKGFPDLLWFTYVSFGLLFALFGWVQYSLTSIFIRK